MCRWGGAVFGDAGTTVVCKRDKSDTSVFAFCQDGCTEQEC